MFAGSNVLNKNIFFSFNINPHVSLTWYCIIFNSYQHTFETQISILIIKILLLKIY